MTGEADFDKVAPGRLLLVFKIDTKIDAYGGHAGTAKIRYTVRFLVTFTLFSLLHQPPNNTRLSDRSSITFGTMISKVVDPIGRVY